eukprot:1241329-Ditylum_brightwellii.AAC.1
MYGKIQLPDKNQSEPWDTIQVDLFGLWTIQTKNNKSTIIFAISMIDTCTHWSELHPLASKISENISLVVEREWFCHHPCPYQVIYNNGTKLSSAWTDLLSSYDIYSNPTTSRTPRSMQSLKISTSPGLTASVPRT